MTDDLDHVFQQILQSEAEAERRRADVAAIKEQINACEDELNNVTSALLTGERELAAKRRTYVSLSVEWDCIEVRRTALSQQANFLRKSRDDAAKLLAAISDGRYAMYRDFCNRVEAFLELYGLSEACRLNRVAAVGAQTNVLESTKQRLQQELLNLETEDANRRAQVLEVCSLEADVSRLCKHVEGLQSRLAHARSMVVQAKKSGSAKARLAPSSAATCSEAMPQHVGRFDIELEEEEEDEIEGDDEDALPALGTCQGRQSFKRPMALTFDDDNVDGTSTSYEDSCAETSHDVSRSKQQSRFHARTVNSQGQLSVARLLPTAGVGAALARSCMTSEAARPTRGCTMTKKRPGKEL